MAVTMNTNAGSICSPALTLSVEALFGRVNPAIRELQKLGWTDFSSEAPEYAVKPGATLVVPVASSEIAKEFGAEFDDGTKNTYTHGGPTEWVDMSATHYRSGYDISGVDIDNGVNANKMKQLFAVRAGDGIARAMLDLVKGYINGFSTTVKEIAPTLNSVEQYYKLATQVDDASKNVLVMGGVELAKMKAAFANQHICFADNKEMATALGFKDISVINGVGLDEGESTDFCIAAIPETCLGVIGRVPTIIARYAESGTQTDEDTGFSVGIVVADDQEMNRQIVSADLWFGVLGTNFTKFIWNT